MKDKFTSLRTISFYSINSWARSRTHFFSLFHRCRKPAWFQWQRCMQSAEVYIKAGFRPACWWPEVYSGVIVGQLSSSFYITILSCLQTSEFLVHRPLDSENGTSSSLILGTSELNWIIPIVILVLPLAHHRLWDS